MSRRVFDSTLQANLAESVAEFKLKAAAISTPDQMWALRDCLSDQARMIDQCYDYRYSQLIMVFARLLREGRIRDEQLARLSEEKLALINLIVSPRMRAHSREPA